MSDSKALLYQAWARLHLLQGVYSLFDYALPTLETIEEERYETLSGNKRDDLVDDIIILRSDIKCLPVTLHQIDFDEATSNHDVGRLINAFDSLLGLFEESMRDLTGIEVDTKVPQDIECIDLFPKLVTLRNLRRGHGNKLSTDILPPVAPDNNTMPKGKTPASTLDKFRCYVTFPPPQMAISKCRSIVESFLKVVRDVFSNEVRQWNAESLLREVTKIEIDSIRDASEFSRASSSLFQLLIGCITCEAEHVARLHLSGFYTGQLEMLLGTGEHDWMPASFIHSPIPTSTERRFKHIMCSHLTSAEYCNQTIHGCFDKSTVWEDGTLKPAQYNLSTASIFWSTLDDILGGGQSQLKCSTSIMTRRLDQIGRKIVGLLLACSLFQLCGSPWLQHGFEREKIHILPNNSSLNLLEYWRPHISCDLSLDRDQRSLSEDVAALGVLILELEANLSAGWTDDDEDYETGTKSNRTRLSRILKQWRGDVTDFYYGIGSACFRFENLVEDFDHPKIEQSLKSLTILYKCIVNPLYQKLVSDFGFTERLFGGVSGLSVPSRQKKVPATPPLVLYDDLESREPDKKSEYAEELIATLENGFLRNIKLLRDNSTPVGLAERCKGINTPERVRIAVLDTGINTNDKMIRSATSRIKGRRSWVGSIEDTYGHGTHVTRLLLQMAPAAEIFIAKISDCKTVEPENMTRIAQAIDWAVEECKVDIISMSFGFQTKSKDIDDAIERAFRADKLMFAAASNEGGNKPRSRPGRNKKVICIHACDGKGNKGDMNPSPVRGYNFTTLGVAVKSTWNKQVVYKSGTSFATPVAAAFAADILEFANFRCELSEEDRKLLYKRDGMLEVLRVISRERDKYDYIQPGHLWDGNDDGRIIRAIQEAIADS
ncbi:hypothetical protein A0O28_0032030 [Trichoderma guizhouense]|uniref:Uncharacterized protein n=1 Tax=Trichoderma guizhouense TaxID=1491466 RepID=A0A1T3CLW8_9HYPO|nr:hypothetical protein A0O28_0032030 [Trichoderma guizhouense]